MSEEGGPHVEPSEERSVQLAPPGESHSAPVRWWGAVTLPLGGLAQWRAGPSTVFAERRQHDWRLWHDNRGDPYASEVGAIARVDGDAPERLATFRFTFADTPDTLRVLPALPDRQVVIRPESTLAIPPGERVTLYASTPVWMALQVEVHQRRRRRGRESGDPRPVVLSELPTSRPSDTWFGPSTLEGELAYAVRTAARMRVDELPLRPHRAVIPVTIANHGVDPLWLTRIAVPMPFLALHLDRHGQMWCDAVQFTRESDEDTKLSIDAGVPPGGERLVAPRFSGSLAASLGKTFSRLLRGGF
jgi:hypothetical protein